MVITTALLTVLIAAFLLGIKWALDLIRQWPHKKPVHSHFGDQKQMGHVDANAASHILAVLAAQGAPWAKWRNDQRRKAA